MSAYEILKHQGVSRLCHFTKLVNLVHIISSEAGIYATKNIDSDIKREVDHARYDGQTGYVCSSVEYPNTWFLRKAKERDIESVFKDWIVFCIDLNVLKIRNIKFSPCNASTGSGDYVYSNEDDIGMLFRPFGRRKRTGKMFSCCATDDQAEILVQNNIPRDMISKIIVGNELAAAQVYSILRVYDMQHISIAIAPDVLNTNWSRMVRDGKRPAEVEFLPEGEV